MNDDYETLTQTLVAGGIAVVRTDTIYGIIALAANQTAVEKVYTVKNRNPAKQCIILVAEPPLNSQYGEQLYTYSAEARFPTSVVVPVSGEPAWLMRSGDSLAYRVVRDPFLKAIIEKVGPVIAPSANPEGETPATTIQQAKQYFGDAVDCYIDGGEVPAEVTASQIIQIHPDETLTILRDANGATNETTRIPQMRYSAGGVLIEGEKVLLIHWDPPRDSYDFPKGALDDGETSEQACAREVFEETGYKTKILSYIDANSFYFQTPIGQWEQKKTDYYLLALEDTTAYPPQRSPYETFQNVWVPISEAEAIITREINKAIFIKALDLLYLHT